MKKTYSDYLFELKKSCDISWRDMSDEERNKYKFGAICDMLDDLSARIESLENMAHVVYQPDRPAFHVDEELKEAAKKAAEAFEEEKKEPDWEIMNCAYVGIITVADNEEFSMPNVEIAGNIHLGKNSSLTLRKVKEIGDIMIKMGATLTIPKNCKTGNIMSRGTIRFI